jgi:hypothetical protein
VTVYELAETISPDDIGAGVETVVGHLDHLSLTADSELSADAVDDVLESLAP